MLLVESLGETINGRMEYIQKNKYNKKIWYFYVVLFDVISLIYLLFVVFLWISFLDVELERVGLIGSTACFSIFFLVNSLFLVDCFYHLVCIYIINEQFCLYLYSLGSLSMLRKVWFVSMALLHVLLTYIHALYVCVCARACAKALDI